MGKQGGDALFEQYEGKLQRSKVMACTTNLLYSLNWFLGFCALTWASAVILGGLLTYLTQHDYYSVVVLLLLEAMRISAATFFSKLVTWKLIYNSPDPQRIVYNDDRRQILYGILPILEQTIQLVVVAISIIVPIRRLKDVKFLPPISGDPTPDDDFDSLETSLHLFYALVLVNGVVACVAVIVSKIVVPFYANSFSLRKYYEKIVSKGMDEGLLHSTGFDLLSWTFQMQADEYRRNVRAAVVTKLYGDMMKFLYYYPKHKGFEAAKIALGSADAFEREAAANIVGSWARLAAEVEKSNVEGALTEVGKSNVEGALTSASMATKELNGNSSSLSANVNIEKRTYLARLLNQRQLLAKLADALDSDESGRAATSSFEKLAQSNPECVLMVRSEGKGEKVADILMDLIHWTVAIVGKPDNAIIYIKAVIPLLNYLMKVKKEEEKQMARNGQDIRKESGHGIVTEEERRKHMTDGNGHGICQYCNMTDGNGHGIGQYCNLTKLGVLKEDLWTVVSKYSRGLKRTQAVAAYAYFLLSKEDGEYQLKKEDLHIYLKQKIKLDKGEHILKEEEAYLKTLMNENDWPWPFEWGKPRDVEKKKQVPWLARRRTVVIASLVNVVILAISSYLLLRYAHF